MIGKWHLGSDPTGFDYWEILPGQGVYSNPAFLNKTGRHVVQGYATDVITDMAIDFIKHRPQDKPFFLMFHHKAPHRPWEPDEKHRKMFADKVIPEPSTLYDDYSTRTDAIKNCRQKVFDDLTRNDLKLVPPRDLSPADRQKWLTEKPTEVEITVDGQTRVLKGDELNKWKYQRYMQDYLACIQSVDDSVGRTLDFLEQEGLTQNTVVIYTSDQGFFLGDHGLYDKRFMYEPSLRMPFVMRWPGHIKPGSVEKSIAINADFAPTFMDIAGQSVPSEMQGRSLVPVLTGNRPSDWRTSMYYRYYHDPGDHNTARHIGVRTETHKLLYFWKLDQWEMYDLVNDPNELHNLYDEPAQQDTVKTLKAEMYRLKKELKDDDQFADQIPAQGVDGGVRREKK